MRIAPLLMALSLPLLQGCAGTGDITGEKAAPSLQAGLQPLAGFIGSRRCSGSFLKSGKAIASAETVSVDLSGGWLVLRHDDEPPFPFHALELWGYDPKESRFVAYMYDSSGGVREFVSPGWDGERFTWTDVDTRTPKWDRFVFEKQPDGGYRFTYETTSDGKEWTGVDSLTCIGN